MKLSFHQVPQLRGRTYEKNADVDRTIMQNKQKGGTCMLKIHRFTCERMAENCVTDLRSPTFSFSVESDREGASLAKASLACNGWSWEGTEQIAIPYAGKALEPFTSYEAKLCVTDDAGETAEAVLTFATGRMDMPWQAKWITDGSYTFTEEKVSPVPMTFRKELPITKEIASASICATAMGIYQLDLGGEKVGDLYFAPGFTSYKTDLQYQLYDVTEQLKKSHVLTATVAGGWAVGSFVFTRKNRVSADRQALLLEVRVTYADGSTEVFGTDTSWQVTMNGPVRMADLYDGETYDATRDLAQADWHAATEETLRISPKISLQLGNPVRVRSTLFPVSQTKCGEETIYDFGQNFAGVVSLSLNGKAGQVITVRHAEILNPDGTLNVSFLRTAKATATYTCTDGSQVYSPTFTYMGFRYIAVSGIEPENLTVKALVLCSDVEDKGSFTCSSPLLNRLQENIRWGAVSNFVDIPTDCPQRDERMGWTGDIAVFANTACFNFGMDRFLDKWLRDCRSEQHRGGGLPNTVPVQGYGFPATMPVMAIDFWGDACVLVPWALYQASGDVRVLRDNYEMMKRYVKACRFWAGFGVGKYRYIWHTPATLHFGDWIAPDVPKMSQWQGRSRWTATASLCNTSGMLSRIAKILGEDRDAETYRKLSEKVADAYVSVFTDGNGKLKDEFQTGYVLPIYFRMFPDDETRRKAAGNLAALARANNHCIGTGFPGTPYILFALADNGQAEEAFSMLMNTRCPSWLYEVRVGATTIWERWDGLDENGNCPIGDDGTDKMISYNHYASGAVGDFLYRRIAGIDPLAPGYKRFAVKPLVGGGLTAARGETETPYGRVVSDWKVENGKFTIQVQVPVGSSCELTLPDGSKKELASGVHTEQCAFA